MDEQLIFSSEWKTVHVREDASSDSEGGEEDDDELNSIQFNFILKTNRQTAVCITNRASIYVMQSVMMDKKHNMNNNNNKS